MTFREWQKAEFGYDCITTFWEDFAIADRFGIKAIKSTFKQVFKEWKHDYRYLTELVIVLNHRSWMHYHKGNNMLSKEYSDIYKIANSYAKENLKGEELEYFYKITD